jgi:hypothetical protein
MLDYDLKELLKTKTTFAIMQYFISFIAQKTETIKKYELMFFNSKKTNIKFILLSAEQFKSIKENYPKLKLSYKNYKDGCVYELNNFKDKYNAQLKDNDKNAFIKSLDKV